MELVDYRFTLDAKKNGVQRVLQGFQCGETKSRKLIISINSNGAPFNMDESYLATMLVLPEGQTTASVKTCEIVGDTIEYTVVANDISVVGTTQMQLKILKRVDSNTVMTFISPCFALEVTDGIVLDTSSYIATIEQLQSAIADARYVYNHRVTGIALQDDLEFDVNYADNTKYVSNALKFLKNMDKLVMKMLSGGLYDENYELIYSWEDLISRNYISVSGSRVNGSNITSTTIPEAFMLVIPEPISEVCYGHSDSSEGPFTGSNIKKYVLPNTLTYIGASTFSSSALEQINIPYGITSIEPAVFKNTKLASIDLPSTITEFVAWGTASQAVNNGAFMGCTALTEIKIPGRVTAIPAGTFKGCTALAKVTLNNVTSISDCAFMGCTALTDIDTSGVTTYVPYKTRGAQFNNCTKLEMTMNAAATGMTADTCANVKHLTYAGSNALSPFGALALN